MEGMPKISDSSLGNDGEPSATNNQQIKAPVSLSVAGIVVLADYSIAYFGQRAWGDMLSVADPSTGYRIAYIIRMLIALALILTTIHRGKASWLDFGVNPSRFWSDLFWSAKVFAIALALLTAVALVRSNPARGLTSLPAWDSWYWLDALVAFPFLEEVVYCSIFLAALKTQFSNKLSILLSTATFGSLHVWAYGGGLYLPAIVLWLFLGLFLEIVYSHRRSLLTNILLHSGANLLLTIWQHAYGPF